MIRNEYRRAFIMLRAAIQGYGGHVRLERRTLTGSMYFIVTAPQGAGPLTAALAGRRGDEYFAVPVGSLAPDRRGQLTLAWQFDPRNIDGRPLEAYAWVVVARDEGCAVALTGNVDSHHPMDAAALSRAVCAALSKQDEPAADLPEEAPRPVAEDPGPTEPPAVIAEPAPTDTVPAQQSPEPPAAEPTPTDAAPAQQCPEPPAAEPAPTDTTPAQQSPEPPAAEPAPTDTSTQGDVKVYTRMRARRRTSHTRDAERGQGEAPAEAPAAQSPAPSQTAAEALGLDITVPWPASSEPLRRLFATQAPADAPLGDGFVYVTAPLPDACGYPSCLIGLKAENGAITATRYALSAPYAPEPPAGLEDYAWHPTDGGGYWVRDMQATGNGGRGGISH